MGILSNDDIDVLSSSSSEDGGVGGLSVNGEDDDEGLMGEDSDEDEANDYNNKIKEKVTDRKTD